LNYGEIYFSSGAVRVAKPPKWAKMAKNSKKRHFVGLIAPQRQQITAWFKLGTDLYYQGLQSGLLILPPKNFWAKLEIVVFKFHAVLMADQRSLTPSLC
jgi:hypothetical protein